MLVLVSPGFNQKTVVRYLYTIGIIFLILQGVIVALYSNAILNLPFAEQKIPLPVNQAERERGLYTLPLGINWMSQEDLGLSPAVVYENGIPLALPNSKPKAIRYDGNGRYSVSGGTLYFSSSDNTDPRSNGRVYELSWPHPIQPVVKWIAYLVSILATATLFINGRWIRTLVSLTVKFKGKSNSNPI